MIPKPAWLTLYYLLWYALLVTCNIYTKRVLDSFPYPFTVAASNLGLGIMYIVPVWLSGMRPPPKVTSSNVRALLPIAVFHALGVAMTTVSIEAGPVALTHTVKTSEPVLSIALWAMTKSFESLWVNLSLLPIIGGVVLACSPASSDASLQFCSLTAVGSNVSFSVRGMLSKTQKVHAKAEDNMKPANVFALIIVLSFCIMVPVALIMEGAMLAEGLQRAYELSGDKYTFQTQVLISGLTYYLCNEAAYLVRGAQSPKNVQYINAVGDTAKRATVIIASAFFFSNDPICENPVFRVGFTVALLGHFVFSLCRARNTVMTKKAKASPKKSPIKDGLKPRKLDFEKSPNLKRRGLGEREEDMIRNDSGETDSMPGKTRKRSLSFEKFRRRRKKSEDSNSVVSATRSMYENGSFRRRKQSTDGTIDSVGGMRSIQEMSKSSKPERSRTRSFERLRRRSSNTRPEI